MGPGGRWVLRTPMGPETNGTGDNGASIVPAMKFKTKFVVAVPLWPKRRFTVSRKKET